MLYKFAFNPYVHNRVPGCPLPYIFINYLLKFFFWFDLPVLRGLTFLEAIWMVIYAKHWFFFSCKFICWKKVVPEHNQGTRVPTRQKFI